MTICLCMIIKDEASVIERCLQSVEGLIDCWVICDTGSTDGTQEIVRRTLADVPGELHERPWVNFGHNRSELMRLARGKADYLLLLDADYTIRAPLDAFDHLTADAYMLRHAHADEFGLEYYNRRLVRGDRDWWYVGVAHEYIDAVGPVSEERLEDVLIIDWADGGVGRELRWSQDAELLEQALTHAPDDTRTTFYLAQTYSCLGDLDRAIDMYHRRAQMGGWDEEAFYALYQAGVLSAQAGRNDAVTTLLAAWDQRPQRIEPLYELARMFREREQYHAAHMVCTRGLNIPVPSDVLFVHRWMYEWGLLFEYSIVSYYVGQPLQALVACDKLLLMDLPEAYRSQTEHNRKLVAR